MFFPIASSEENLVRHVLPETRYFEKVRSENGLYILHDDALSEPLSKNYFSGNEQ